MISGIPQDFGDWLSPILVKELRQGLRTRVFTVAFIALQTVLLLFMFAGMREDADDDFVTGAFWFLLFFILVVITPLRGLNTLSSEVKQNTLDLLSLTRLNALRICFGKWAALFTQALLFAVAVLPYVVLRYFSGGVDLLLELALLVLALTASAVLCAVSVALSSLANSLTRTILIIGLAFFLVSGTGPLLFSSTRMSGTGFPSGDALSWAGIVLLAAYLTLYCISAAATRIAPAAENYSTHRRLLSLTAIAVALVLAFTREDEFLAFAYAFFFLLAVDALTESSTALPSVHGPFLRMGLAGRPLQFLLAPGWHSGAVLVSLLLAILSVASNFLVHSGLHPGRMATVHLSLAGVFLLPVLLTEAILKGPRDRFTPYCYLQAVQLALGGFFLILGKGAKSASLLSLGSPLPPTSLFMTTSREHRDELALLVMAALSFLAIAAALLYIGRGHLKALLALKSPRLIADGPRRP